MNSINRYNPYNGYLQHHGIPGQKWGVQNGPPYPLDAKDKSKAEKKAERSKPKRQGLTDGQKTAIKLAAAGVIVAAGSYALYKSGAFNDLSKIGGDFLSGNSDFVKNSVSDIPNINATEAKLPPARISEQAKKISEATGFKLKKFGSKAIDDCKPVNPNYDKGGKYTQNCFYSSMAWCMRRMGLDVQVRPDGNGQIGFFDIPEYFKNVKPNILNVDSKGSTAKAVRESVSKAIGEKFKANRAFGIIDLTKLDGSGHFFSWEKNGEHIDFFDPQSGGLINPESFFQWSAEEKIKREFRLVRLDDLEFKLDHLKTEFQSVRD